MDVSVLNVFKVANGTEGHFAFFTFFIDKICGEKMFHERAKILFVFPLSFHVSSLSLSVTTFEKKNFTERR